ncbi:ATP-binding protein [Streptomyces sp. NPDC059009]|uniref:ATP-binding protein n=1 Tax=Streptomyces sp. NPDC059009 TaxID=3346694 RepID=UPI0036BF8930
MELATPPSAAARAPGAWYSWWLLPAGLVGAAVAAVALGSDGARIPIAGLGVLASVAAAACVRQLLRTREDLARAAEESRATQVSHSQQWQQHVASLERQFEERRIAYETRMADETAAYEARISDESTAYETRLADESADHEARLADAAAAHEARLAHEVTAYQRSLHRQQELLDRLGGDFLPAGIAGLRGGEAIDDVLPPLEQEADVTPEFRHGVRRVLRTGLIAVEEEFNRSTSAEQAVISIGNRIHVLTGKIRGRLHELQGEHGRVPAVAQGLMELDQAIGPADCLAASIGVLGGTVRPGRQWQEPQRLLGVVRGGIGRIKDFDRIDVRQLPELGVDGGLVDHLTLIFAHLLDNAARYSPPTEPVVVSGKEVPNGVGIEIQDAGKGLTDEKKQQALQSLEGVAAGAGLGGLSEDAHLGLRVVGTLARKYGIKVTFADSPWLGTSVVVVVPHKYFSPLPAATAPEAPTATATTAEPAASVPVSVPVQPQPGDMNDADTTAGGLPRRRSKRAEAATETAPQEHDPIAQSAAEPGRPERSAVPPDASFTGLAAFATAGRDTDESPETPGDASRTEGSD